MDKNESLLLINNLAQQIINAKYPIWKQLNLLRKGGVKYEEMCLFIDSVRENTNSGLTYNEFLYLYFPPIV